MNGLGDVRWTICRGFEAYMAEEAAKKDKVDFQLK